MVDIMLLREKISGLSYIIDDFYVESSQSITYGLLTSNISGESCCS